MCTLSSVHLLLSHSVFRSKLGKYCPLLTYTVHLIKKLLIMKDSLPKWKDILNRVLQCVGCSD